MQSSKDKSPESDSKNTAKVGMDRETIDFASAKVAAADATEELAAASERLLRLQAEMQNLRNRTSRDVPD